MSRRRFNPSRVSDSELSKAEKSVRIGSFVLMMIGLDALAYVLLVGWNWIFMPSLAASAVLVGGYTRSNVLFVQAVRQARSRTPAIWPPAPGQCPMCGMFRVDDPYVVSWIPFHAHRAHELCVSAIWPGWDPTCGIERKDG